MVGQGWRTAPPGYRVIWKETPADARPDKADEKSGPEPRATKRRRTDRRNGRGSELPTKLGGKDRRKSKDRRHGFGKKPDLPAE